MGALSDLRVIELGDDVASAYATKLLADLGAEVIDIEPPGQGDALRRWGPFPGDRPDPERSGLFHYLGANKRSVALDLLTPAGVEAALGLVAGADLVVESSRPDTLERLGLGADAMRAANPRIALVRISPFGQSGPYRDFEATDLVVQAAGAWVSRHGMPSATPVRVGGRIPEYLAASYAAGVGLTAVEVARARGEATVVDLSIMECLVGTLPCPMLFAQTLDKLGMPPPQTRYTPLPGVLRCQDGWVGVNALTAQHWADVCTLFEVPEFLERHREIQQGAPVQWDFFARIQPWLERHCVDEIVERGQALRIPTNRVGNGASLTGFEQLRARSFLVADPDGCGMRPGLPFRLSRTPPEPRRLAPRLGEHTDEILRSPWPPRGSRQVRADDAANGESAADAASPASGERAASGASAASASVPDLPFCGLRVLDLGTFWAGPYLGMYLATMGAEVIKIESVQRPDGYRFIQTFLQLGEQWYEQSTSFQATNLGKRDLTLDLSREEGREIFFRLLATADVVIENFAPRVMESFGLGYETLCQAKPDVVMVRMPGFGLEGPWRDWVAFALVIEQVTGMSWVTGHADGPPLSPGGFIDCAVAMHALVALQAALAHRRRTGEGQLIEMAQIETGVCITAEQVIDYAMNGRVQGRTGNRDREYAPQGVYPCAEDRWVALSVRDDDEWLRLVEAMQRPAWARGADLATVEQRRARHDWLDERLAGWTRARTAAEVVEGLRERRIPVAEALVATRMYGEPQLEARDYYQAIDHPCSGRRRYPRWPFRCSFGPDPHYGSSAPTLGQDNQAILGGELGLSTDEIERLHSSGVIGERLQR